MVAYKLSLPPEAAIHDTFHVRLLNLFPNLPTTSPDVPQYWFDLGNAKEPEAILETKTVKRCNTAATKVLVQWKGESPDSATWEFYHDFAAKYPLFNL